MEEVMKVGDFVRDKRVRDVGYVSAISKDGMIEIRFSDGVLWMERTAIELTTRAVSYTHLRAHETLR